MLKNKLYTLPFLLLSFISFAQENVKIYAEQSNDIFSIYVDNPAFCPVSVAVEFEFKNIKLDTDAITTFLVKANSTKVLLATASVDDKSKASKFNYKYSVHFGDDKQSTYDKDFVYQLPFEKGNAFGLYQGYNGSFSHQNENSLDFTMPVGTPVKAIRDGIVIKLVENNVLVCPKKECAKYNNYVIIYHNDGTFAEYAHLKRNGVLVNVGDQVVQGQTIATSGNTGFSSGPHLHLTVFLQKLKSRKTLETKFKIGDGTTVEFLKEKEIYSRNY